MHPENDTLINEVAVGNLRTECPPYAYPPSYREATSANYESKLDLYFEKRLSENIRNVAVLKTSDSDNNSTITNVTSPANTIMYSNSFDLVTPLIHEVITLDPHDNMHYDSSSIVEATYSLTLNARKKDRFIIRHQGLIIGCLLASIQLALSILLIIIWGLDATSCTFTGLASLLPLFTICYLVYRSCKNQSIYAVILFFVNIIAWLGLLLAARVRNDNKV